MKRILLILCAVLLFAQVADVVISRNGKSLFTVHKRVVTVSCTGAAADGSITLEPGGSAACTVSVNTPAPAGGLTLTGFQSSDPSITFPASVTIPAGATSAQVTVAYP